MAEVLLTTEARDDLADIDRYSIENFGIEVATNYMAGFDKAFALLREHPEAGAARQDVDRAIRSFGCGRHSLFYEIVDERVIIQRVLHKAMDHRRVFHD